jgi:hypothetical protein
MAEQVVEEVCEDKLSHKCFVLFLCKYFVCRYFLMHICNIDMTLIVAINLEITDLSLICYKY